MIGWRDIYKVVEAMIPLYFALLLGYGSVRWWRVFTAEQRDAVNKLVSFVTIPFFTLQFALRVDPFAMNYRLLAADAVSKLLVLAAVAAWAYWCGAGSYGWSITTYSLSALTNTLVFGVPLVAAMYGGWAEEAVVQLSVVQVIVWLTVLLFLLELRKAWGGAAAAAKEEEGINGVLSLRASYGELMKVVGLKLALNPNICASVVGITWAFIANRWHLAMPGIIEGSVLIMSKAGAGMAMFSMGIFISEQEKIIACGPGLTLYGMILRFVVGPAAMAIGSLAVGLHGGFFRLAIIQVVFFHN